LRRRWGIHQYHHQAMVHPQRKWVTTMEVIIVEAIPTRTHTIRVIKAKVAKDITMADSINSKIVVTTTLDIPEEDLGVDDQVIIILMATAEETIVGVGEVVEEAAVDTDRTTYLMTHGTLGCLTSLYVAQATFA
jgi:hypothetical protein